MTIKQLTQKISDHFYYKNVRSGKYDALPDDKYIRKNFKHVLGKYPDLENPKTFNEKLQWLKLHDRKPEYVQMVDKYAAKDYVEKRIGGYTIPTLGVWDSFDQIDFDALPNQFVLKVTHDSGGLVICKDKKLLDKEAARRKIEKSLNANYYLRCGREWPYKDVPRRIIAEKYMVDESGTELKDYKFFCFDGAPKFVLVVSGREGQTKRYIYDMQWKRIPVALHGDTELSAGEIKKPDNFDEMVELAHKLSNGMIHLRVDFYAINGKTYFGELTFYHMSGMERFYPEEYDYKFGEMIKLPIRR